MRIILYFTYDVWKIISVITVITVAIKLILIEDIWTVSLKSIRLIIISFYTKRLIQLVFIKSALDSRNLKRWTSHEYYIGISYRCYIRQY